MWTVYKNGFPQFKCTPGSIDLAEGLKLFRSNNESTLSLQNEAGEVIASASNRAITGLFVKQVWGGRKGDDAITVGEESFDATNSVLRLGYSELKALEDHRESTDEIGRSVLNWEGPCEVEVVQSVCDYFGISDLQSLTEENYRSVMERVKPLPVRVVDLSVTLKVSVAAEPDLSIESIVEGLQANISSTVPGSRVRDVQKTSHTVHEEPKIEH